MDKVAVALLVTIAGLLLALIGNANETQGLVGFGGVIAIGGVLGVIGYGVRAARTARATRVH